MHRWQLIGLAGAVTVTIAACASEETPPVAQSPVPVPATVSPSPAPINKTATQPLVAQRPAPPPSVPGLIPSTNAGERGNQVETNIKVSKNRDPFAGLPPVLPRTATNSVPNVAPLPTARPNAANSPNRPTRGNSPGTQTGSAEAPKKEVESPSIPKIQDAPLGYSLPPVRPRSAIAALPPRPSTDNAQAVEITGVVTVGANTQAIVVAPGDATSRYVDVGQRVSNGRVLVKRIEPGVNGGEPTVILEENGIEIPKAVGQKPPQPANKPAA